MNAIHEQDPEKLIHRQAEAQVDREGVLSARGDDGRSGKVDGELRREQRGGCCEQPAPPDATMNPTGQTKGLYHASAQQSSYTRRG
jgi:hypothetical protein